MRFSGGLVWFCGALAIFGASSAYAGLQISFTEEVLPETISQLSAAATSRAVRAYIQDWYDDARSFQDMQRDVCERSNPESQDVTAANQPALRILRALSRTHIQAALEQLTRMRLSEDEQKTLERLWSTRTDGAADDESARELAIDTEWLLIRVAKREYAGLVAVYQKQSSSGWGALFGARDGYCSALTLRLERDTELMRAGNGILTLLQAELR